MSSRCSNREQEVSILWPRGLDAAFRYYRGIGVEGTVFHTYIHCKNDYLMEAIENQCHFPPKSTQSCFSYTTIWCFRVPCWYMCLTCTNSQARVLLAMAQTRHCLGDGTLAIMVWLVELIPKVFCKTLSCWYPKKWHHMIQVNHWPGDSSNCVRAHGDINNALVQI